MNDRDDREDGGTNPTVDQFFDALTDEYSGAIERCFPRYREMLWALLDYLPAELGGAATAAPDPERSGRILELGSGTGNLTVLLAQRYPEANIDAVDVSADSLAVCRQRLGQHRRLEYHTADFRELRFDAGVFDLVISSISIHHLTSSEKQLLFTNIRHWLTPRGIFAYADQHAGATESLYRRHIDNWKAAAMNAGSSPEEWEMWMKHQADHDYHDTLPQQLAWLRDAGFDTVDCPWRYLLWTVVQAIKRADC